MQTELLKWAQEWKRYKARKIWREGLEWDPQAMKNTSILIIVITCLPRTSAASLFLYLHLSPTDRDTHKHAADTFQIVRVTAEEKVNPAFRHHTPVLMESQKGQDEKKTHFPAWSGEVPHQCFCWDMHKWFVFLQKCKLINTSCSGQRPCKKLGKAQIGLKTETTYQGYNFLTPTTERKRLRRKNKNQILLPKTAIRISASEGRDTLAFKYSCPFHIETPNVAMNHRFPSQVL